ncbi:hypothetical protein TRVL_05110 [Trypanosoma vivax]|nr:hypothetical protein TRVL_05110 [Trypanosoma vivax]
MQSIKIVKAIPSDKRSFSMLVGVALVGTDRSILEGVLCVKDGAAPRCDRSGTLKSANRFPGNHAEKIGGSQRMSKVVYEAPDEFVCDTDNFISMLLGSGAGAACLSADRKCEGCLSVLTMSRVDLT